MRRISNESLQNAFCRQKHQIWNMQQQKKCDQPAQTRMSKKKKECIELEKGSKSAIFAILL